MLQRLSIEVHIAKTDNHIGFLLKIKTEQYEYLPEIEFEKMFFYFVN